MPAWPSDRLSGHIVRGVVEGVGSLHSFTPEGEAIIVRVLAPAELLRSMVVKGPVCIDGISLTIVAKDAESFSVSIVQYTQEHTNLNQRKPGDPIKPQRVPLLKTPRSNTERKSFTGGL